MKPHASTPTCQPEEWDNPAMAEFKRLEAENRVAFGKSPEAENWLSRFHASKPIKMNLKPAPKAPARFPFKPVKLPW